MSFCLRVREERGVLDVLGTLKITMLTRVDAVD